MFELKRKKIIQVGPLKEIEESYMLMNKHVLNLNDYIDFNIFIYDRQESEKILLFLKSDITINAEHQKKIKKAKQLYVSKNEKNKYEHFLEKHIQNIINSESMSIDEKTNVIYESSAELTHSLYVNPDSSQNVQRSEKIVKPILHSIIHNQDTIASYIKIIEYDYYTHTHSLNVSIYALSLGVELNLSEEQLTSLGKAALLHDLGKSKIERNIVNKNGELTKYEFEQMKMHPALGYEIAVNIGIDDKDMLDGIRHHHEKLDGMGYPDHLMYDEITLFPRIIGICDVFDALTTRRSYKSAMRSYDALYLMETEMYKKLDIEILKTFIKMLHS